LEQATNVRDGVHAITRTAVPGLNCIMADAEGHIAWTVAGLLPKRRGMSGRLPTSWADGKHGWDGYLAPGDVPRIVDPESGQVWSANQRPVTGQELQKLGEGGYVLGARATQIRDALTALPKATAVDMLAIQLDDRALLMDRWQALLMQTLSTAAAQNDASLAEMRALVASWGGHASVGSVGYRIVRNFRFEVSDALLESILASCIQSEARFRIWHLREREEPVWRILSERPAHLLPTSHANWDAFLITKAQATRDALLQIGPLRKRTWGERNTTRIQHPLSLAVPALARWLDMKPVPLPGDGNVPRMQSPTWGASQRMVVVVGDEANSIAHMPVGQSGHPRSPYYRNSHEAWMHGSATPLLPGEVKHTLQLLPE
jgi:penicillin amidase